MFVISAMRTSAVMSFALLVACERTPERIPTAASPPPDRPPPVTAPCERVRKETRAVLDPLTRNRDAGDLTATFADLRLGWCQSDARNERAWAIVPEIARLDPGGARLEGRYALVRYGPGGARAYVYPAIPTGDGNAVSEQPVNFVHDPSDSVVTVAAPVLYDYNGDGESEVALVAQSDEHESATRTTGRVWTFTEGGVFLYERAAHLNVSAARDVDRDGRPDLLTHGPYEDDTESCGSGFTQEVEGPLFVAHALPDGSFSTTDQVALGALRTACPSRPAQLVPPPGDAGMSFEIAQPARNVVCARVWGATEAEVTAMIRRECTDEPLSDEPDAQRCNRCVDAELLGRWARVTPPARLQAEPRDE